MSVPSRIHHWVSLSCLMVAVTVPSLAAAGDLLVSSRFTNNVLRYDSQSGTFIGVFASGNGLANPNGIAYGPDRNLYVGLGDQSRVLRFDGQTGAFLDEFVGPSTPGGLLNCRGIAFGPEGDLYVCSASTHQVLRYDGATGEFVGVAASGQGMNGPVGLTFGPDGNLYVGCALSNAVYAFTTAGTFIRSFQCGINRNHVGTVFDRAGRLLVAQSVSNNVLAYDPVAGTCLGVVAQGNGLNIPIYLALDVDGNLLVGSFGNDSVLRFDPATGAFLGTIVSSNAGGLDGTHSMAFIPDPATPIRTGTWGALKALRMQIAALLGDGHTRRERR
jgi:outer membrane protein assembly factor BamB